MSAFNEMAWKELQKILENPERLGVSANTLECGSLVVDCGAIAPGGFDAGLAMARVGMAGLGSAQVVMGSLDGVPWPYVETLTDRPLQATLLCQAANWPVDLPGLRGMGSGPACLLNTSLEVGKLAHDAEVSGHVVLILEANTLPDSAACVRLAESCGVAPDHLAIMIAPTSSLAGSVQIAARSVETALHKLHQMTFDVTRVVNGFGRCAVAMPTGDDLTAMGKTNDAVLFGCQVWLAVCEVTDDELVDVVAHIPSSTSP
ncbi:MAG TPA: methenyltetrahydromethanopterin cyclohydrolase, partial [Longilinea sp.]|nr:methenyltetrahydromethanopterin cyclohydrolase [Longilinea sp.]